MQVKNSVHLALLVGLAGCATLPSSGPTGGQIEKTASKSRRAKLLKLADKTSNLRSLVRSPPSGWTQERLRDYVVWAEVVVRSCRGLNATLEADFDAAYAQARQHFGA